MGIELVVLSLVLCAIIVAMSLLVFWSDRRDQRCQKEESRRAREHDTPFSVARLARVSRAMTIADFTNTT